MLRGVPHHHVRTVGVVVDVRLHPHTGDGEGQVLVSLLAGVESVLDHLHTGLLAGLHLGTVQGRDDVRVDVAVGQTTTTTTTTTTARVTGRVGRPVDDDAPVGLGGLHRGETHLMAGAPRLLLARQAAGSDLEDQDGDDDDDDHEDEDHGDADTEDLPGVEGGRTREITNIEGEVRLHSAGFVLRQAFVLTSVTLWN